MKLYGSKTNIAGLKAGAEIILVTNNITETPQKMFQSTIILKRKTIYSKALRDLKISFSNQRKNFKKIFFFFLHE